MQSLSISEAAAAAGVTPDTIRYYDREGLLDQVTRDSAGNRRFTADDVGWLQVLRCLRDTGMAIADLRAFCSVDGDRRPPTRLAMLEAHRDVVRERIRRTQEQLTVIEHKIDAYRAMTERDQETVPEVVR